jgi:hypothetical protein
MRLKPNWDLAEGTYTCAAGSILFAGISKKKGSARRVLEVMGDIVTAPLMVRTPNKSTFRLPNTALIMEAARSQMRE